MKRKHGHPCRVAGVAWKLVCGPLMARWRRVCITYFQVSRKYFRYNGFGTREIMPRALDTEVLKLIPGVRKGKSGSDSWMSGRLRSGASVNGKSGARGAVSSINWNVLNFVRGNDFTQGLFVRPLSVHGLITWKPDKSRKPAIFTVNESKSTFVLAAQTFCCLLGLYWFWRGGHSAFRFSKTNFVYVHHLKGTPFEPSRSQTFWPFWWCLTQNYERWEQ